MARSFTALLCAPHRPLFLLAGLWALAVPGVWFWPAAVADPVFWHMHELMFGMGGAAVGGYLLTALPNWTGRRTGPLATAGLVAAWLAGRGALLVAEPGRGWGLAAALAYPLTLAALLLVPVLAAQAWRRLASAGIPLALAGADAALLGSRAVADAPAELPLVLVLALALLLGIVGGRVVPAFTRSRLEACRRAKAPREGRTVCRVAVAAILLAMLCLLTQRSQTAAGAALLVAGVAEGARLAGWRSLSLRGHADILMLHLAWLWLPVGLVLTGTALLRPMGLVPPVGLHALTMGAMGSMIFAIASRPFMARAPGRLIAGRDLGLAFALICAATLLRLLVPGHDLWGFAGYQWSAMMWSTGWAVFLIRALRSLSQVPPYPVLSARRQGQRSA